MTYNLLIVDDEFLMKNKLINLLDWKKHGFNLVATADNGKAAIEFINKNKVDIIITDVCMPVMDGVELTRYIHSYYPKIQVIVVSSYNDFNYVKNTLKNGAVDYILKNELNRKTILKILDDIKGRLNIVHEDKNPETTSPDNLIAKQQNLKNLILGIDDNGTQSQNSAFPFENSYIITFRINNFELFANIHSQKDINNIIQNIQNVSSQSLSEYEDSFIFYHEKGIFVIFLPLSSIRSEQQAAQKVNSIIEQIQRIAKKLFNLSVSCGLCRISSKDTIHYCYLTAYERLNNVGYSDEIIKHNDKKTPSLSLKSEKKILSSLEKRNTATLNQAIDEIFEEIKQSEYNNCFQVIIGELIAIAAKTCDEYDISVKDLYDIVSSASHHNNTNISQVSAWAKELFSTLIDMQNKCDQGKVYSSHVKSAIKIMEETFGENISLNSIAKTININPSYLSRVFKEETNDNLSNYLLKLRIEKSKQFIENGETNIKYLASKIGFNSYNYFFTAFKKYVGCTPVEYKKRKSK